MKEFKGTPGPWNVYLRTYVETDLGGGICEVFGDLTSLTEDEANANLIAAAPELLKELQWAVLELKSWIDDNLEGTFAYEKALSSLDKPNAAIAKALGE